MASHPKANVLVVEDSREIQLIVSAALAPLASVSFASTVAEALAVVQQRQFSLILLDVHLPDGDGFKFLSVFRTQFGEAPIPVIFLTAKSELEDKLLAFSLGAEDYIVKPFEPLELKARVQARIRPYQVTQNQRKDCGEFELDPLTQRVTLKKERREVELSGMEFRLLLYFVSHPEHVLSRSQILDQVWGTAHFVSDRNVDTHVYSLRRKLGLDLNQIQSIPGVGYRFSHSRVTA
jgi:DNA-binding response OmpR family regulator